MENKLKMLLFSPSHFCGGIKIVVINKSNSICLSIVLASIFIKRDV